MARTSNARRLATVAGARTAAAALLLVAGVPGNLAGCASGARAPAGPGREPSAGRWRPVVLPSASALRLRPPPAAGSDEERAERSELITLEGKRTPEVERRVQFWNAGASLRWNEVARDLVARHRTSVPMASRVYAVLSVANHDALIAAFDSKYFHDRRPPDQAAGGPRPLVAAPGDPSYPCAHATVGGASAAVLSYLYPEEAADLEQKAREQRETRLSAGVAHRSDISAGDALGRQVALQVIDRARQDHADEADQVVARGAAAAGAGAGALGRWSSSASSPPLLPAWGRVTPWLSRSMAHFVPGPPPMPPSPGFQAALAEVKALANGRTREQARVAALWADGAGSYSPAGRWNKIAADLIAANHLSEPRAARVFALLNMAVMDAGIACWETKYRYNVIRPSQADDTINTPVGLPNFPSYTSAHATLSGAAAAVLGHLFPGERGSLWARAEEAALSRVYAGIHYRFDERAGLAQGRAVAGLAISRARSDGAP